MRTLMLWGIFGRNDLRLVRRDSMLAFLVAYPLVWSLVSRWAVPALAQWLRPTFELPPYYPLIASYLLVLAPPLAYGSVIGFLLLDERDDGTMTALRVAPVPFDGYLAYRFLIPIVLGVAIVWVVVPLAGIVSISFPALTAVALVAAMEGSIMALFLGAMAGDKVEGFALAKAAGVVPAAAGVAYFVETPWQLLFGIVPTYWPAKAFWIATEGGQGFMTFLIVGLLFHLALLWALLRRFDRLVLA